MSRVNLAYLAGLFDGEGSINFYANKKDNHWRLLCSLQMAGSYIPQLFQFNFGGTIYRRKRNNTMNYDSYHWHISETKALAFLKAILPYLKLKHPQAELGIKSQERKARNWHRGWRLSDEERALREAELILMKGLKKETYEC